MALTNLKLNLSGGEICILSMGATNKVTGFDNNVMQRVWEENKIKFWEDNVSFEMVEMSRRGVWIG